MHTHLHTLYFISRIQYDGAHHVSVRQTVQKITSLSRLSGGQQKR